MVSCGLASLHFILPLRLQCVIVPCAPRQDDIVCLHLISQCTRWKLMENVIFFNIQDVTRQIIIRTVCSGLIGVQKLAERITYHFQHCPHYFCHIAGLQLTHMILDEVFDIFQEVYVLSLVNGHLTSLHWGMSLQQSEELSDVSVTQQLMCFLQPCHWLTKWNGNVERERSKMGWGERKSENNLERLKDKREFRNHTFARTWILNTKWVFCPAVASFIPIQLRSRVQAVKLQWCPWVSWQFSDWNWTLPWCMVQSWCKNSET